MGVTRERVDDEYGVLPRGIEFAPGLVGERDLFQVAAEFGLEGAYSMKVLIRLGRSALSPGPRV